MSNVVKLTSRASVEWEWDKVLPLGDTKNIGQNSLTVNHSVTDTTAATYVDQLYTAQISLANNASQSFDLFTGTLKDYSGASVAITSLRAVGVVVVSGGGSGDVWLTPVGTDANIFDAQMANNAVPKPIKVGGAYVEVAPGGYTLDSSPPNFYGFTVTNKTGGTAVINVSFAGKA